MTDLLDELGSFEIEQEIRSRRPDLAAYMDQLRQEIREGEWLLASMQHLKKEGHVKQADVNELVADIKYLEREHNTVRIRAEAIVKGVTFPEAEVSQQTTAVRERMKERADV